MKQFGYFLLFIGATAAYYTALASYMVETYNGNHTRLILSLTVPLPIIIGGLILILR